MTIDTDKLVNGEKLIEAIFPPGTGPTLRTLQNWRRRRIIPYFQICRNVYYSVPAVREALERKNLIRSRNDHEPCRLNPPSHSKPPPDRVSSP